MNKYRLYLIKQALDWGAMMQMTQRPIYDPRMYDIAHNQSRMIKRQVGEGIRSGLQTVAKPKVPTTLPNLATQASTLQW